MIIMESKSQPIFCLSCIFFIFMITKTILSIEIWKYTFQEKQKTFRIRKLFLNLFIINPFFLKINDNGTSASVGFITKICKLHESLLTASQFPYLLNTIEYIVANSLPLRTYCNRLPFLVSNILICISYYFVWLNLFFESRGFDLEAFILGRNVWEVDCELGLIRVD